MAKLKYIHWCTFHVELASADFGSAGAIVGGVVGGVSAIALATISYFLGKRLHAAMKKQVRSYIHGTIPASDTSTLYCKCIIIVGPMPRRRSSGLPTGIFLAKSRIVMRMAHA
jgi:hypothetical protein